MASDLNSKLEVGEILEWEHDGLMRPERVLERLDAKLNEYSWLKETEQAALRQNFDAYSITGSDGEKIWDETIFIKFLTDEGSKNLHLLTDAGPILFGILLRLVNFPFRPLTPPTTLNYTQFSRSLFWLLPERAERFFGGSGVGDKITVRARTPADTRRLLFESLADVQPQSLQIYNAALADEIAEHKGVGLDEVSANFATTNYDRDGDQIYHDLLDVLSATQPVDYPNGGHYRDDFRTIAKRLHASPISLEQLQIPQKRLEKIVKLLIAGRESNASVESQKTASIIVEGLTKVKGSISWYDFDREQRRKTPYLLPELYAMFSPLLTTPNNPTPEFHQTTSSNLTSPILRQLSLLLAGTVSFGDIKLIHQTTLSSNPNLLVASLKLSSDFSLLLITGNLTLSKESHLFAFFSPSPSEDEQAIAKREDPAWETALIVQLEPVFDVFRGRVGHPAWTYTDDELIFSGYEQGVQLKLSPGAQRLRVARSGSEILELEVTKLEVWGE
ncbi:hypothetical protein B0O99DRAFT_688757 [Bisporella sp. PMI_857]|nr:hypothetical protein B0O99DRAFT_688757 [Bisporella sp. PMI_857]